VQLYRPTGCIHCVEGFKGRTAIHESLYITREVRDIIMDSSVRIDTDAIRAAAVRHGMQDLRQSGIELVKRGVTTLDEILANTTHEAEDETNWKH